VQRTDIELMLQVRDGSAAAFEELARRYREPLRRFFAAVLPDRSLADDCAQETLLRLWLNRDRYEPTGRFSTYLFQIGKHYWLNQRKKRAARTLDAGEITEGDGSARGTGPEAAVLRQERSTRLHGAIRHLPPAYRSVFELGHLEGLKYAEIACRLGIPLGTVKSRMAEAVRRLRAALENEERG
jgi:RNA polymerase sigma-70 factor, ECF subfamily